MNCIIEQSARGYDTLSIEALLATKRRIFLTKPVDSESCAEIIRQLMFFNSEDAAAEIVMYINTPGGEVDSGFAVYDVMRMIEAPVRTVCIGVCASMGALIYLGGERREMLPHSRLMIHDPSFGGGSYAGKKPHELQSEVNKLSETHDALCRVIAERTGRTLEEVCEKTASDTYFTAEQAISFGLAHAVAQHI